MSLIVGGAVLTFLVAAAYQLGLFDRPAYKYQETLLVGGKQTYFYAIVALCTEKDIGKHFMRLTNGVSQGIEQGITNGKELMIAAAKLYQPERATDGDVGPLNIGLYFDDPYLKEKPRWVVGYAIQGESLEEIQKLVADVQKHSGLSETIRAISVGKGSTILKGRIPIHNGFTPVIAPMIQWTRAFRAFEDGGYRADNGRCIDGEGAIALDLYTTRVSKSKCSLMSIDYVILMGDVKTTWNDTYPINTDVKPPVEAAEK